jgi:hypothetical protein
LRRDAIDVVVKKRPWIALVMWVQSDAEVGRRAMSSTTASAAAQRLLKLVITLSFARPRIRAA